jgi:hypothetical protein
MNRKEFLLISIAIFLTIIVWVMVEIIRIQNSSKLEQAVTPPVIPVSSIDIEIFEKLNKKQP